MRKTDIVEYIMSWNVLDTNSRSRYVHYNRVGKMTVWYQRVLGFLGKLVKYSPVAQTLVIIPLNDWYLYMSYEEDIFVSMKATDALVKNDYELVPFHAKIIYRPAGLSLVNVFFATWGTGKWSFRRFPYSWHRHIENENIFHCNNF